jgi:hypothetical protein
MSRPVNRVMSRSVSALLCLAILAPGCAHTHHVTVDGDELRRNAPALQREGVATVDATDKVEDDGASTERREEVRAAQRLMIDGEPHTLGELVHGCFDASGSYAACALDPLAGFPIEVRSYEARNIGHAVAATAYGVVVGATVAAVACGLGCRDGSTPKLASEVTMGVVGTAIVVALGWALLSCVGRGGSPGCRD